MKELFTAIVALAVVQLPPSSERRDINDAEPYAVYHAVLLDDWMIRHAKAERLVIGRDTVTYDRCLPSGGPMETEWRPVLESYKAENAGGRRIVPDQPLPRPYIVVDVKTIHELFKPPAGSLEKGWSRYHELYPGSRGYFQLSAVGFDADKRRALVYASHHCGGLCGGGSHVLLERRDSQWERVNPKGVTACAWAS